MAWRFSFLPKAYRKSAFVFVNKETGERLYYISDLDKAFDTKGNLVDYDEIDFNEYDVYHADAFVIGKLYKIADIITDTLTIYQIDENFVVAEDNGVVSTDLVLTVSRDLVDAIVETAKMLNDKGIIDAVHFWFKVAREELENRMSEVKTVEPW